MIDTSPTIESIVPHLEAALEAPSIPARAHIAGRQLLERLTSPIRVVVTGHPGSGKSQLLNLLAEARIVPEGSDLPTLELRYGEERRATVQFEDGTTEAVAFDDIDAVSRHEVALLRIEAPLPILKAMTLTEIVTGGTAEHERDGVLWAAERADIVLWCSQEFTPAEQWLWSAFPERLKDHGFLILTKADKLIRSGVLGDRIAALEDTVAEEFHSLVPIATMQGLKALLAEGGPDEEALAGSGARALSEALRRHVEQGRRADLDAALLFLSRFGDGAAPDLVREEPPPASARPEPVAAETQVGHSTPEDPKVDLGDEAMAHAEPQAPNPEIAPPGETHRYLEEAIGVLTACGRDLAANLNDDCDTAAILDRCARDVRSAAETLEAGAQDGLSDVHETTLEVSDRLVLIQLEGSRHAAADAVTLLLQLRRDLAVKIAA